MTPFLQATAIDAPSPPVSAVLCNSLSLRDQYLCQAAASRTLKWAAPSDLGAGEDVPVPIDAFYVQSADSLLALESSTPVLVDPVTALQSNGQYQSDAMMGSIGRVWLQTAAGQSISVDANLSGSCTGVLSVRNVVFGAGEASTSVGVAGDSDVDLSLVLTIDTQLPADSLVMMILPDGFFFSSDPDPVLTHHDSRRSVPHVSILRIQ